MKKEDTGHDNKPGFNDATNEESIAQRNKDRDAPTDVSHESTKNAITVAAIWFGLVYFIYYQK